jgi:hypothetical protein
VGGVVAEVGGVARGLPLSPVDVVAGDVGRTMADIVAAATGAGWPGVLYVKLSGMRRALPWLTVGLLVLGLGAGTGLGIAGQTATPSALTATRQISLIVAATRGARTARFSYVDLTTSPNRLLRSSDRGSGQIDFRADTMQTAERDRSISYSGTSASTTKAVAQDLEMDDVWIGRTQYLRFSPQTSLSLPSPWIKGTTWPKGSFGPLGTLGQVGPIGDLGEDESMPGFRVEEVGTGMVHGVETTQYQVVVPLCGRSAPPDGITSSMAPLQLWVDSQGRLVQARQSTTEDITKKARLGQQLTGVSFPTGRITAVSTIDLDDFGAPAAITAPPAANTHSSGGSAIMSIRRGRCR